MCATEAVGTAEGRGEAWRESPGLRNPSSGPAQGVSHEERRLREGAAKRV